MKQKQQLKHPANLCAHHLRCSGLQFTTQDNK
jgi:hypothetical protein